MLRSLTFREITSLQFQFQDITKTLTLFCIYDNNLYRVTGASSLGDVWLTKDFSKDTGYEKRVTIDECSDFSKSPLLMR